MARKKKLNSEDMMFRLTKLFGGVRATDKPECFDMVEVFASGFQTGIAIGEKQARAEQRKREGNGEG